MIVLITERVQTSLRGELTRWLLEPKTGVFVGRVSAMVRDRLWDKVCASLDSRGGCILIHSDKNEQGFSIRIHGHTDRMVVDIEGLQLIQKP